jgi:hypothetical protein
MQAGGSNGICRVSNVLRSPSPDPSRSAEIMKSTALALSLICVAFCGCATHTVTRSELSAAMSKHSMETIYQVRYMGSESDFNYLSIKHTVGTERFRIMKSEFPISDPFPLTKDSSKWRVLASTSPINFMIEPQSLKFGK